MNRLTRNFHLVLESLVDNVVLAVVGILMLILVVCGVVIDSAFDMVSGGVFLGVCIGIIGNDVIERIVNDEEDDDILDYDNGTSTEGEVKGREPTEEEAENGMAEWCWECGNDLCRLNRQDAMMVCDCFERRSEDDLKSDPHFGGH